MTAARKLAAILAADVVGYSRLMGEDEAGTARLVRERREAATPLVRALGGRLVKTTGDGVLLEFPSVVAAVECAILIQKMMAERNAAVPEAKRILYRVGVNLGDVLIDGEDILGDGVNVAARLEGICEPGAICLSEDAWRQARGRAEAEFADLGEQRLKNIAQPVRAYAVTPAAIAAVKAESPSPAGAAIRASDAPKSRRISTRRGALAAVLALALLAAGGYAWRAGYAPRFMAASVDDKLAHAPRLSIVALPFENLSGDKEQDYFADGITDDLTTDLSHLEGSFVISRGTAFTYKGKPIDAKEIGRDLGVRYLLEGSVRRLGDKVEVNAQLISTETGAHVWADRFEGDRTDLGNLQLEFVSRLANSLGVELVKAEALRAARERPRNPDAVDLAMQAEVKLNLPSSKGTLNEAVTLSEHAVALDPHNVRALTVLANALAVRADRGPADNPADDIVRAEKAIDVALALEPDSSSVHIARAWLFFAKRQWASVKAEAEATIADDPNNPWAHGLIGFSRLFLGHAADAFADFENALRLSPRDPSVPWWQYDICHLHSHLAQWEEAIPWCTKAAAGLPQSTYPLIDLAGANAWAGHEKEAREAAAKLQKVQPGFTIQSWAGQHWSDDPTFNAQIAAPRRRRAQGGRSGGRQEDELRRGVRRSRSHAGGPRAPGPPPRRAWDCRPPPWRSPDRSKRPRPRRCRKPGR
jgi:TolB-like protein/class 3 adenylate cyclase